MRSDQTSADGVRDRLARYADEVGARQVLLLDRGGFVICAATGPGETMEPVTIGAVAAGTFAAARELAVLFGESECQMIFQQGARLGVFTLAIADRWFFITAFDRQAHVGLVQVLAAQAAGDLALLLAPYAETDDARDLIASEAFRADFDDALDRIFQDDLSTPTGGA